MELLVNKIDFENMYLNFISVIRKAEIDLVESAEIFCGFTNKGEYYSTEVLFELLRTISSTYGRLAYHQEKMGDSLNLLATFSKLSNDYYILSNSLESLNPQHVIKYTTLAKRDLEQINVFEFKSLLDGV